jgi:hypothetical protein
MTPRPGPHDELGPDVDPQEAAALLAIGERLERERPLPRPAFRGDLQRALARDLTARRRRPQYLWRTVAGYVGSGLVLLLVAALGALGAGPLGS